MPRETLSDPYKFKPPHSGFSLIGTRSAFQHHLNEFAFANGMSADLLRRVGAIYFRDIVAGTKVARCQCPKLPSG